MIATKTTTQYHRPTTAATYIPTDKLYEVRCDLQPIGYALGNELDILTYYAAAHPGKIDLRELPVTAVTTTMASAAMTRSLSAIAKRTLDTII